MLNFLFDRHEVALEYAEKAEEYINNVIGLFDVPVFNFFDSLSRLNAIREVKPQQQKRYQKQISRNQKKMRKWADHAPMNHEHRWILVEAEQLKLEGKNE